MGFFLWLIIFIIIVSLLTLIHEYGHYKVAKASGVRVMEFSIGFGPIAFQRVVKGTAYSFRWLPFGGYVSVLDDSVVEQIDQLKTQPLTEEQKQMLEKKMTPLTLDEDFTGQKRLSQVRPRRKVLFAAAGVLMNLAFLFVVLIFQYQTVGRQTITDHAVVNVNIQGYDNNVDMIELDHANLFMYEPNEMMYQLDEDGRIVFEVDGLEETTSSFDTIYNDWTSLMTTFEPLVHETRFIELQFQNEVTDYGVSSAILQYKDVSTSNWHSPTAWTMLIETQVDSDEDVGLPIDTAYTTPIDDPEYKVGYIELIIGDDLRNLVLNQIDLVVLTFPEAVGTAFLDTFRYLGWSYVWLFDQITFGNVVPEQHHEVLMVNSFTQSIFGLTNLLVIFSALMVSFNFLPIPPMDGWKAAEWTYEGATGKKIKPETQKKLNKIGMFVIMALFIIIII